MTAPTAIFKGDADDLADVQDIDRLVKIVFFLNKIIYIRINVCSTVDKTIVGLHLYIYDLFRSKIIKNNRKVVMVILCLSGRWRAKSRWEGMVIIGQWSSKRAPPVQIMS